MSSQPNEYDLPGASAVALRPFKEKPPGGRTNRRLVELSARGRIPEGPAFPLTTTLRVFVQRPPGWFWESGRLMCVHLALAIGILAVLAAAIGALG